ncbi:MAG: FkbM family methyltransferase [Nitrospiraceae bacterium]|nr:MAG: FkbM family methyltransferase [Nitrospiraceae bacterium]
MKSLNALSDNPQFRRTGLYRSFMDRPLGFIDIGAAGGVHPLVTPAASLTHCICFEPGEEAYRDLLKKYESGSPFSRVTIINSAVGAGTAQETLHVTRSLVNTSLLEPRYEMVTRYRLEGFRVEKTLPLLTGSLDEIILNERKGEGLSGEFIKLDCQGAEYSILKGAEKTLESCMAIMCEAAFFQMYKGQKLFADLDSSMRERGFQLYGLWPRYVSSKRLDRRIYDSEERIIEVDALYFRDPLDVVNSTREFTERNIEVLLLVSILSRFYDFALELVDNFFSGKEDERRRLTDCIHELSGRYRESLENDTIKLLDDLNSSPEKTYLLCKKFIDRHKSNNSVDFVKLQD